MKKQELLPMRCHHLMQNTYLLDFANYWSVPLFFVLTWPHWFAESVIHNCHYHFKKPWRNVKTNGNIDNLISLTSYFFIFASKMFGQSIENCKVLNGKFNLLLSLLPQHYSTDYYTFHFLFWVYLLLPFNFLWEPCSLGISSRDLER